MVTTTCLVQDDPNRIYDYCPSFAASTVFAALFICTTFFHLYQAVRYRRSFCWVLLMAGAWEIGGYVSRSLSITRQADSGIYTAQFLLILLAPLWVNAFIYMIIGRMIHFFLKQDKVFGVRARKITLMFVLFDITAFCVQLAGGMMTNGTDTPIATVKLGLKIYTSGVGLQLAFIAVFCGIAIKFQQDLKKQDVMHSRQMVMNTFASRVEGQRYEPYSNTYPKTDIPTTTSSDSIYLSRTFAHAKPLLTVVWIALSLIILRNLYRLIEYAMGGVNGNTITNHEWWMYVFDAIPMLTALLVLNVYHPGRVLQGEKADFKTEDKARKAEKKAEKQGKKDAKRAEKEAKKEAKAAKKGAGYTGVTASSNDSAEELV